MNEDSSSLERAILNSLLINLGYKEGEKVGIIFQETPNNVSDELKKEFEESIDLSNKLYEVFKNEGVDVELFSYLPEELRNGVDAPKHFYEIEKDILFLSTVFSLSHTPFRKHQSSLGTRIASMPGFNLRTFEDTMNVDYSMIENLTKEYGDKISSHKYAKIIAKDTEILVELNNNLSKSSSGMLVHNGAFGNLPGAEAYNVPITANGYITIPKGFGGDIPLEYDVKFLIQDGRFIKVICENQEYANKIYEKYFSEENFNVLAELGIGTNPKITSEYVKQTGWNTLLAEKIYGSVHFANGNNHAMGGDNNVPIHIDWVVPDAKIEFLKD